MTERRVLEILLAVIDGAFLSAPPDGTDYAPDAYVDYFEVKDRIQQSLARLDAEARPA